MLPFYLASWIVQKCSLKIFSVCCLDLPIEKNIFLHLSTLQYSTCTRPNPKIALQVRIKGAILVVSILQKVGLLQLAIIIIIIGFMLKLCAKRGITNQKGKRGKEGVRQGVLLYKHRRRIETEEKAKVLAVDRIDSILFRTIYFPPG